MKYYTHTPRYRTQHIYLTHIIFTKLYNVLRHNHTIRRSVHTLPQQHHHHNALTTYTYTSHIHPDTTYIQETMYIVQRTHWNIPKQHILATLVSNRYTTRGISYGFQTKYFFYILLICMHIIIVITQRHDRTPQISNYMPISNCIKLLITLLKCIRSHMRPHKQLLETNRSH